MSLELTYEELQACYRALDAREAEILQGWQGTEDTPQYHAHAKPELDATRNAASKVRAELARMECGG